MRMYLWALSFMKPYQRWVIMLSVCGLVTAACELLIPKFVQHFIDVVYPAKDSSAFAVGIFAIITLLVFKFASGSGRELSQRIIQENTARDLQISIFRQLRRLGFSYYEKTPSGVILTLLNTEVSALQKLYRQYFPDLLQNTIFTCISFLMMFMISTTLTLMFIPCFLLYYLFGPYFEKRASWTAQDLANSQMRFGQKAYESISALTELRATYSHPWDSQRVMHETDLLNKYFALRYWYAYWRGTVRRLSYYLGCIILFIYGFYAIQNHTLSVGEFVAYLLYYFNALHRLTSLITLITEQRVLLYQVKNLYNFMHITADIKEPKNPYQPKKVAGKITFDDVHFAYPGTKQVVNGVTLTIHPGEKVAIVGKSGCGKSTLLKLIGRFYDPERGQVLLDDVPIQTLSLAALRNSLSYVFQDIYLFGSSVRENIRFAKPDATEDEIIEAAKKAQLHEMILNLPEGYDTLVGERGVKLSGGQKQRLSLARMFLRKAPIVILDEPTSALDNVTEGLIMQAFHDTLKEATIVTVAHRLSTIREYDRIVVMEAGTVIEAGTYEELIARKGAFYRLANEDVSREVVNA